MKTTNRETMERAIGIKPKTNEQGGKTMEKLCKGRNVGGNWVEGFVKEHPTLCRLTSASSCFIEEFPPRAEGSIRLCTVSAETVGQYTGLTDKNGTKIFEGDIVEGVFNTIFAVCFDEKSSEFKAVRFNGESRGLDYYGGSDELEVIGNVHNAPPELDQLLKNCKAVIFGEEDPVQG